jgi:hypothetical protein
MVNMSLEYGMDEGSIAADISASIFLDGLCHAVMQLWDAQEIQ